MEFRPVLFHSHNGIRSLEAQVGKDFGRVRLGVGHPGHKDLVHGHVLSDFAKADKVWLETLLDAVAGEIPLLVAGDAPRFMSRVAEIMNPPRNKEAAPKQQSKPAGVDGVDAAPLPSTTPLPSHKHLPSPHNHKHYIGLTFGAFGQLRQAYLTDNIDI